VRESVRLGRIAGIAVGLNWSVLVIFFLIAFGLAAGRFPLLYADLPGWTYAAAGLVTAVVFFLSLLAHEISHAIVAQRNGVGVEGIVLWMFGGVARLTGEADDPGADLRISGVGPLVSALLAAAFYGVAVLVARAGAPGIVVGSVAWLAIINGMLAIFNLMPAAPLDGGRILRAFLWSRHGDRSRAAITATRAGQVFGWLLVAGGLFLFAVLAGFGGLWLALIGWFITSAARAEEQQVRVRDALAGVRVSDVMTPDPAVVRGDVDVATFIEDYVLRNRYSAFPLQEPSGELQGLVTLNRVKQVPRERRPELRIRDIACPMGEVATARPDEELTDLLPRMAACGDGRVLVVEDGQRLVGIVSPTDVSRAIERATLRDSGRHADIS
jgi:Zn-dependent protease/CBS domain-containing protein